MCSTDYCYKGQLYINIQDKATSVIAVVPR